MIVGIIVFIVLTLLIAAGTSIWSTTSKEDRKSFALLILKSGVYSAIALAILFVIVNLF